jgi:hypothetical protein
MRETVYAAFEQYLDALVADKPPAWDQLPDIGLYMDQVTGYLERQLGPLFSSERERGITPSMINNYVKAKIIPRAESKKYSQEHIALLLAVFTLKKALSVQDMGLLLADISHEGSCRDFYDSFRTALTECGRSTAKEICAGLGLESAEGMAKGEMLAVDDAKLRALALRLAVEASLRSLAAERLLAMLQTEESPKTH